MSHSTVAATNGSPGHGDQAGGNAAFSEAYRQATEKIAYDELDGKLP